MKTHCSKPLGCSKSSHKREVYSNTGAYLKKQDKSQINNLTLLLKELEKEQQTKSKMRRRKEIKIRAGINDMETIKSNRTDQ